jgi:hypothetical protein
MTTDELQQRRGTVEPIQLMALADRAVTSESMEQFISFALPWISRCALSPAAFFYVAAKGDPLPRIHHCGLYPGEVARVERICGAELDRLKTGRNPHASPNGEPHPSIVSDYWLWPMRDSKGVIGFLGVAPSPESYRLPADEWENLVGFLGHALGSLLHRAALSRQVAYLNTYLTVSTLLAQSPGLHDLIETVLFFCTDVVLAEEASVLLLDHAKQNFVFFETEGASKSALEGKAFPTDRGIAGAVLSSRRSEVINDVQSDPRFFRHFDTESGILTRNMIAIPLVAGEEPVGVLEVINKAGGLPFSDDDHLLLHFIADEIAFAIRNARIFEYVVKSYCKQRQGFHSCEGCQRPLGSWTPCVKYRQAIC